jgi:hypothetical protein
MVQVRLDNNTLPLVRNGVPEYRHGTITQDAQRAVPLLQNTVMALNVVTLLYVPWINVGAGNGEAFPIAVYIGDNILAADLVAGNIEDCPFLVGGAAVEIDESLLVYDQGLLNRDSVIGVTNGELSLRNKGFYMMDTVDQTQFEN